MSTGEKIRDLRKAQELTQDQLERLTGVDQSYISMIENGRRKRISGEMLLKFARALGCTIEDLVAHLQPAAKGRSTMGEAA